LFEFWSVYNKIYLEIKLYKMERMTSATSSLTENQRKMALMSGAAFLGATSALLVAKKLFSTRKPEFEEE